MLSFSGLRDAINCFQSLKAFETPLSTRTGCLSVGQKQRLAIARALVREPKFLLFDEATSSVDAASEKLVQAALAKACQGRTLLVVGHRLSTVRNARRIVVLDGGMIKEAGTHDELRIAGGLYAKMLWYQVISTTIAADIRAYYNTLY